MSESLWSCFFSGKIFLLKMLLWTDKNTILTISWSFFAKVQKTSTQRPKKVFEDDHSPKKRQFSVAKTSGGMESNFFNHAEFFCQWNVLVPHFTKKSVELLKQIAKCLFFFKKKFPLGKDYLDREKRKPDNVVDFLPKSDIFPLTDRKTIVDHYFSIKNFVFLQQNHLDAVKHFSRICRVFSTKHNELPLKLRKRFCNWVFSGEKIRKESLWKREIQLWQPCWYSLSKIHRYKFFKRFRSLFERKYQIVKFVFRKETISLKKHL